VNNKLFCLIASFSAAGEKKEIIKGFVKANGTLLVFDDF
jgi:hypothetical protein